MIERITTDEEYFAALARIHELGTQTDADSAVESDFLATLLENYEEKHPDLVIDADEPPRHSLR
jgi:hypothetical protein